jgi:hypothetical protein
MELELGFNQKRAPAIRNRANEIFMTTRRLYQSGPPKEHKLRVENIVVEIQNYQQNWVEHVKGYRTQDYCELRWNVNQKADDTSAALEQDAAINSLSINGVSQDRTHSFYPCVCS